MFTWSDRRIHPNMAKLDKFFVSVSWDTSHPYANVNCLASDVFNYVPILLSSNWDQKKIRCRFERMWLLYEGFKSSVALWWQRPNHMIDGNSNLVAKLRLVHLECNKWCRMYFYNVKKRKKNWNFWVWLGILIRLTGPRPVGLGKES